MAQVSFEQRLTRSQSRRRRRRQSRRFYAVYTLDKRLFPNSKDAPSFFSGCWNTGTNPDLAFTSVGYESWSLHKRILQKFLRLQHQTSLITPAKLVTTVPTAPHKQGNLRKAHWKLYNFITNKLAKDLPYPDSRFVNEAYQDFCYSIFLASKRFIPRRRRNNYRSCRVRESLPGFSQDTLG